MSSQMHLLLKSARSLVERKTFLRRLMMLRRLLILLLVRKRNLQRAFVCNRKIQQFSSQQVSHFFCIYFSRFKISRS